MLIQNSYEPGEQEDPVEWGMFFLGGCLNLVAVSSWTWEIATFPILIFVLNGLIFFMTLKNFTLRNKENHENDSHIS
jgi:hypothetical protein